MTANKTEASIRNGISFIHQHNMNVIKIWASSFNGKEKIFLNNKLVSEKRNLKKEHTHTFVDDNGSSYSVVFKVENLRKGIVKCSIINEGITLKTFRTFYDTKSGLNKKRLIILILISVIYGTIHSIFKLPILYFILFIVAIMASSIFNSTKNISITIKEE